MKYNFKEVKTGVFGIQGSGKTYFSEHSLMSNFRKPFIYLLHDEDFKSCGNADIYIPKINVNGKIIIDRSPEHLNRILGKFIEQAKKGIYDCFVLDEASTFLPKDYRSLQKYPNIIDFIDNHRHYGKQSKYKIGCAFVYMSRRPQVITTEITETSEFLIIFALDGKNVKEYFGAIHQEIPDLMEKLQKEKHNFIVKELGHSPKIYEKIKQATSKK